MKKMVSVLLCAVLLIVTTPFATLPVSAAEPSKAEILLITAPTELTLEDFDYNWQWGYAWGSAPRRPDLVTGSKALIMRNKYGDELWRVTLHAAYAVKDAHSSGRCIGYTYETDIAVDSWEIESVSSYRTSDCAVVSVHFVRKCGVVVLERETARILLNCDSGGVLR